MSDCGREKERQMDRLEPDQIEAGMAMLSEWAVSGENLQRTISFADFRQAIAFVNKLADAAEAASTPSRHLDPIRQGDPESDHA